jgi:hypothetical protein
MGDGTKKIVRIAQLKNSANCGLVRVLLTFRSVILFGHATALLLAEFTFQRLGF